MGVDAIWKADPRLLPDCGIDHGARRGSFDETARRVDHVELSAAELLVAEGHAVRSLKERRGIPTADFEVCGGLVEIKSLIAQEERPGRRPANECSVHNRLMSGVAQGPVTILMTKGSGLRPADAASGVRRFVARGATGMTSAVRIVGDGWDLSWSAPAALERRARTAADPERGAVGAEAARRLPPRLPRGERRATPRAPGREAAGGKTAGRQAGRGLV